MGQPAISAIYRSEPDIHSKEWLANSPVVGKAWGRDKTPAKFSRLVRQFKKHGQLPSESQGPKAEFDLFKNLWKRERSPVSAPEDIVRDWPYRAIIALGPEVVPLILRELEKEPGDWFWALAILTGANPVAEEDQGKLQAMTKAWLTWGKDNNLL